MFSISNITISFIFIWNELSLSQTESHEVKWTLATEILGYLFLPWLVMNCFCSLVHRRIEFSLISSRDHCQKSSPSWISDTPRAGLKPAQNPSSGFIEWSCAVVITTKPRLHLRISKILESFENSCNDSRNRYGNKWRSKHS